MPPKPIEDRLCPDPPTALAERIARLALYTPNILRIPVDPSPPRLPTDAAVKDPKRWFIDRVDKGNRPSPPTSDNEVTFLIDGKETFPAMVEAIKTASGPDHFIYLLGWVLYIDFPLTPQGDVRAPSPARETIRTLFETKSRQGTPIRAMLWKHTKDKTFNVEAVDFINGLTTGVAIHDGRVCSITGSHHQKILLVGGSEGLIGFCGGIDINPDRVYPIKPGSHNEKGDTPGAPFHDVHCRIRGPAAENLLTIFRQRWDDHPDVAHLHHSQRSLPPNSVPLAPHFQGTRRQHVQIGRTYGNPRLFQTSFSEVHRQGHGIGDRYDFAPEGERTIRSMIIHAIQTARRFIYMEDQYMVDMEACDELCKRANDLEHVTILIPQDNITCLGLNAATQQTSYRRWRFKHQLEEAFNGKARIFTPKSPTKYRTWVPGSLETPGDPHTYVHAKMYVFDDEYAIIGSANCNRRSWTNDSEVAAGFTDQPGPDNWGLGIAHRLRIALWAEHLGLDFAELIDGVAAARHWVNPPETARIEPYEPVGAKLYQSVLGPDPRAGGVLIGAAFHLDDAWQGVDPDGT
jgi:phosphatidylserine/phosphatidylglycerophosphate/cardiolipin synthase-like enzyme